MIMLSKFVRAVAATAIALNFMAYAKRPMENLGRGVVAVRQNETTVLVSWRLLGLETRISGSTSIAPPATKTRNSSTWKFCPKAQISKMSTPN